MELAGHERDRAAGCRGLGMRANPLVRDAAERAAHVAPVTSALAVLARGLLAQAALQGCRVEALGADEASVVWTLGLWASSLLAGSAAPLTPPALAAFAAWRQALPTRLPIGNHGRRAYDLRHLEGADLPPEHAPFARFFLRAHGADANLCQFILKHMLEPRADDRATLRGVAAFMDQQRAQRGDPCGQLDRALRQHLPADAEQQEIVKLVQHWRLSQGPHGAGAAPLQG